MGFDVLELGCKGFEMEILEEHTVWRRHLVIEMYLIYGNINIEDQVDSMSEKVMSLVIRTQ